MSWYLLTTTIKELKLPNHASSEGYTAQISCTLHISYLAIHYAKYFLFSYLAIHLNLTVIYTVETLKFKFQGNNSFV